MTFLWSHGIHSFSNNDSLMTLTIDFHIQTCNPYQLIIMCVVQINAKKLTPQNPTISNYNHFPFCIALQFVYTPCENAPCFLHKYIYFDNTKRQP